MKYFSFAAVSLVILNLTAASPVAAAGATGIVHVSVTVPRPTITISQLAGTSAWTGANREALPFSVTVASSDLAGYTFTVTGTNATSGQFALAGSAGNALRRAYTVTGSRQDET